MSFSDHAFMVNFLIRMKMGIRWSMNMFASIRLALVAMAKWYVVVSYSILLLSLREMM